MAGPRDSDRDVVARIKAAVDIVDVVGEYVALRKSGRDFSGLCPFHEEKTPSFHVSREKQVFHCFGCGAGGDVIRFLEMREGLSFREVLEQLSTRTGIPLPERSPGEGRRRSRREALHAVLESAAAFYHRQLMSEGGAAARAYLAERGVREETVRRFGLGVAPDAWDLLTKSLLKQGHSLDLIVATGLARRGRSGGAYDAFRNRLMFPVWDERGRVVAFGGRRLEGGGAGRAAGARADGGPKYLNSPESEVFRKRETWYGLHLARDAIRKKGRAIVVEGYMDCLAAHQAGFTETVASLGTALSEEQARILARHTSEACVAYDADAAGQSATLRGFDQMRAAGLGVRLVALPPGMDPDELLRAKGPEAFGELVESGLPLVEYLFQTATRELDLGSVEGKAAAVARLAPALGGETDPVRRDYYVQRYAQWLGIEADAVRDAVNRWIAQAGRGPAAGHKSSLYRDNRDDFDAERGNTVPEGRISPEERKERMAEDIVLAFLLRGDERAAEAVWSAVEPAWFAAGPRREIAEALHAAAARREVAASADQEAAVADGSIAAGGHREAAAGDILGVLSPEAQALAASLLVKDPAAVGQNVQDSDQSARVLQDCLGIMAKHRVRARERELQREIRARQAERRPVPREMLLEHADLVRRLKGRPMGAGVRS